MLTAASATGQLVFLPLLAGLTELLRLAAASITIAIAALAAVPLVLLLMREQARGRRAAGLRRPPATPRPEPPDVTGNPITAAFAGLRMASDNGRVLAAGRLVLRLRGVHQRADRHPLHPGGARPRDDRRSPPPSLLASIGVFDIIGTTASGWLTDRVDPRVLLAWYYGLRGLSLLALPTVLETRSVPLLLFIAFYGLDWVATVPPTIALCAQVAGPERTSVVFGWVFASHQIGAAVAAFAAGVARSEFGTYSPAFVTAGWLCAAAAVLAYSVGRSRRRPLIPVVAEAAPLA